MNRALRCLALAAGLLFLMTTATPEGMGQIKKGKKGKKDKKENKDKKAPAFSVVEFNETAGDWSAVRAKVGIKMLTDRDYRITAMPKELVGGTFVTRSSDEKKKWVLDGALQAKTDATAYAAVMVRYLGKEVFDTARQSQFEKEGWEEVEGTFRTTFPKGEDWRWKVYRKEVDEGFLFLKPKGLNWDKSGTTVLYAFKKREADK